MKLGYPCINRSLDCSANSTFRLGSYSKENLIQKVQNNLDCLMRILKWNVERGLFFFRISSEIVPFASHPVCRFDWEKYFRKDFERIGKFIEKNGIRISMHPDQFVLINAKNKDIVRRSFRELEYHCKVLDLMKLDFSAKVQIHVGGVYGDKREALERFVLNYGKLPDFVKRRLALENDDRLFSLRDCLYLSKRCKIPVIFDVFHHRCYNDGKSVKEGIVLASKTWGGKNGILMVDYSSQKRGARVGTHAEHINVRNFKSFFEEVKGVDFDVMLEIKDKERSAVKAIKIVSA